MVNHPKSLLKMELDVGLLLYFKYILLNSPLPSLTVRWDGNLRSSLASPLTAVPLQDTLEMCSKEIEFKCILFALCYFHAVVAERRKFGAQGWNRSYPFNNGDLTISINVLYNYLEANPKVRGCTAAVTQQSSPARTAAS